jgi:hypothetical protein
VNHSSFPLPIYKVFISYLLWSILQLWCPLIPFSLYALQQQPTLFLLIRESDCLHYLPLCQIYVKQVQFYLLFFLHDTKSYFSAIIEQLIHCLNLYLIYYLINFSKMSRNLYNCLLNNLSNEANCHYCVHNWLRVLKIDNFIPFSPTSAKHNHEIFY